MITVEPEKKQRVFHDVRRRDVATWARAERALRKWWSRKLPKNCAYSQPEFQFLYDISTRRTNLYMSWREAALPDGYGKWVVPNKPDMYTVGQ